MVQCPYCNFSGDIERFKSVRGSWRFRFYEVHYIICPKCGGRFYFFSGRSPMGKQYEFVMRIKPKPLKKVHEAKNLSLLRWVSQ